MSGAAVVLAAGGGTRFGGGGHKLLAAFRGHPVVWWAVSAARDAGLAETLVVGGCVDLEDALPAGVRLLLNSDWAQGQATSLQVAIATARSCGHDHVVVGLGDQPLIPAEAWTAVAAETADIAVATYGGRRRNPVRLSSAVWDLLPQSGDEGARVVMRSHPELVREVPCPGEPADIDTKEDLDRWS